MASGLLKKVREVEAAIALLGYFYDRLRYLRPTMASLLGSACSSVGLESAAYLTDCCDRMHEGETFRQSWRASLREHPGALGAEETELLSALGDVLGATDLDSQLTALAFTRERMEHRLTLARQDREKYHRLYSTLGVLAGFAIAIIMV